MKLKKVTVEVEVLMGENDHLDGMSLEAIENECLEGDWSYAFREGKEEIIEGREACESACLAQGSDLSFFFPDEEEE